MSSDCAQSFRQEVSRISCIRGYICLNPRGLIHFLTLQLMLGRDWVSRFHVSGEGKKNRIVCFHSSKCVVWVRALDLLKQTGANLGICVLLNTVFGQKLVLLKTEEKLHASGNLNRTAWCMSSSSSLVLSAPQLSWERAYLGPSLLMCSMQKWSTQLFHHMYTILTQAVCRKQICPKG